MDTSNDRQSLSTIKTDRTISTVSKPVEQPKTYKVLAPKNYNFQLEKLKLNESSKNLNENNDQRSDHNIIDNKQQQQQQQLLLLSNDTSHRPSTVIDRRLAVSLSSLSSLLKTNKTMNISDNNMNMNSCNSISSEIFNNKKNNKNKSDNSSSTTTTIATTVIDHFKEPIDVNIGQLDSMVKIKDGSISPSPLSGRDVEQHTTSQLRRFELEI